MKKERFEHLRRIARLGGLAKGKLQKSPLQRFIENIKKDDSGCWIWTGNLSRGYGAFKIDGKKSPIKATRWAYEHFTKEIIPSNRIFVCHTCDVRACVNPDHLFLGSTQDNMDDAKRKDRFTHGEGHHCAKLTQKQALEIIELRKQGISISEIEKQFNVSRQLIWRLSKGNHWTLKDQNEREDHHRSRVEKESKSRRSCHDRGAGAIRSRSCFIA